MIQKHPISAALQAAYTAVDECIPASADEKQQIVRAKVRGLLAGYDAKWSSVDYETIEVERMLLGELINPTTNRTSRSYKLAGKVDALVSHGSRLVLLDHKTTSQDIADPDAPYWRQLAIEGQVSHYILLLWLNGQRIDDAVWDVIRKPQTAPKTLAKKDRQAVIASKGQYFGRIMSDATLEALQTIERETVEMYEARLAHDCTVERPQWFFQRKSVPRLNSELLDYSGEVWEHSQDMLFSRGRDGLPPRNSGACMLYGTPCKFLGICSGHDSADSDNWQHKKQVHNELPELEGDGRDVLTNSRIRCFQTCRRKHYYEYLLGIERQDEEERETLFFGTTWHKALDAWLLTFSRKDNDNGDSFKQSVNAADSSRAGEAAHAG